MSKRPLICALGVCARDFELAALWLRWTAFLSRRPSGDNSASDLLVVLAMSVTPEQEATLRAAADSPKTSFKTHFHRCDDEMENVYPKSASHLFLRTLEAAEKLFPGSAMLWCESDTVAMKPSWFSEIAAEFSACNKPNLGMLVGTEFPHQSGVSIYAANWRELMPSIAGVLDAPDYKLWGPGKGQPWDVFCRAETTPLMAESKLMHQVWKDRGVNRTELSKIPAATCLFHQCKSGQVVRDLAARDYPGCFEASTGERKFYLLNGHPSRFRVLGHPVKFSWSKFRHGWRAAVCSDEVPDAEASILAMTVGRHGLREIDEEEFVALTGRDLSTLPERVVRLTPAANAPRSRVFVMLGRYGDICNILPLLWREAQEGRRPALVVAEKFADILDGVSYVDRIVWPAGDPEHLPDCIRWLRREKRIVDPVVCQVWRHPTDRARLTASYQTEAWRLAGRLADFGRDPLVFDKRDATREDALSERNEVIVDQVAGVEKPVILVGLESISSPLESARDIFHGILNAFRATHQIVNLSAIRADKIFDLLGFFERAACLVASDTVHLHLARACNITLIALVNDGWRGSVVPHAFRTIRYADATPEKVVADVTLALALSLLPRPSRGGDTLTTVEWPRPGLPPEELEAMGSAEHASQAPRVVHVVDLHGDTERHARAQATWEAAYEGADVWKLRRTDWPRNSTAIGDARALPYLKDLLTEALGLCESDNDVVVWSNSDVSFQPGAFVAFEEYASKHGAFSMRRVESNGEPHMGREVFGFRAKWLRVFLDEFPDFFVGAPAFDLVLAAFIRTHTDLYDSDQPIITTLANLGDDMPPADMPPGLALHESHASTWAGKDEFKLPANVWNVKLAKKWAKKNAPLLKL